MDISKPDTMVRYSDGLTNHMTFYHLKTDTEKFGIPIPSESDKVYNLKPRAIIILWNFYRVKVRTFVQKKIS